MRGPWRAAVALALHIGFFALPIAVVLGLLAIALFTFRYSPGSGVEAALAAVVVAALFAVGLRAVLRPRQRFRGVPVERGEHKALWELVDSVCAAADAPDFDEVRITSEPAVAVREDSVLLGLRPRSRCLEIGLPLLAALNVSELRAVLAQEVGLLSAERGLAPVAERIAGSVQHALRELPSGPTKWLFGGYARMYAATAGEFPQGRFLADAVAARTAGKRPAITALRKAVAIKIGWREYSDEYLSMASAVSRTPDVLLGFKSFMEHPARRPQLSELVKQKISDEQPPADGRPSAQQRVAALKRVKTKEQQVDEQPAFSLLHDPRSSVPAIEDELLVEGLGPRIPWPELARLAGAEQVAGQTAQLSAAVAQSGLPIDSTIGGVLAAIHHGDGRNLVNPVLNPGLDPDRVEQAAVDTLTELLGAAVVDALICARRAHHELNWGGKSVVRLANGRLLDPDRLVRPAVCDPRLVPGLHRALVDLGVPLNHSRPPAADPEPVLAGIISPVRCSGGTYDLLVTDRGLLLLPSAVSTVRRLAAGALGWLSQAEREKLRELAQEPIEEARQRPGAQWADTRDIAAARLEQRSGNWSLRVELYLDEYAVSEVAEAGAEADEDGVAELELRSCPDAMEHGDPYGGIGELMGARLSVSGEDAAE